MRINPNLTLQDLDKYGFKQIQDDDDYVIDGETCYEIGHSRRGQYYYYIVFSDGRLGVYGSEPDGSGGSIALDDVILQMFTDGALLFDSPKATE